MADRLLAEGMDGYADEVIAKMVAPYNVTALPEVTARAADDAQHLARGGRRRAAWTGRTPGLPRATGPGIGAHTGGSSARATSTHPSPTSSSCTSGSRAPSSP